MVIRLDFTGLMGTASVSLPLYLTAVLRRSRCSSCDACCPA